MALLPAASDVDTSMDSDSQDDALDLLGGDFQKLDAAPEGSSAAVTKETLPAAMVTVDTQWEDGEEEHIELEEQLQAVCRRMEEESLSHLPSTTLVQLYSTVNSMMNSVVMALKSKCPMSPAARRSHSDQGFPS